MPPGQPRFRTDLEGLRGAAILLVVLFHAGVAAFAGGFVGVDLFFVLSGYFITGGLARELEASGRIDLNEFWGRRMLRLSPPLLVVLMATLALVMTLFAPIDRGEVAGFARYVAVYAGNVELAANSRDYFSNTQNPLLHTWSLAVEEQFYLLWPLLLLVPGVFLARQLDTESQSRRPLIITIVVAGTASLIGSIAVTVNAQPTAFYGVLTRVWEFALGGFVALVISHPARPEERSDEREQPEGPALRYKFLAALGMTGLVAALVMFDQGTPYPGYAALLPALATVAIIIGNASWFDIAPLRWLGRVSYAWYLWHWPLVGLGVVLHPSIGAPGKVAWSLVALVLAWLTYRYVEGSARDGRLSRIPTGRLALYGVGASVAAALIAWGAMVAAEQGTGSGAQKRFADARSSRMEHDCWATTVDQPTGPCEFGDRGASTTLALLGDSHAEHWLGALDRAGKERGWKIVARVKGGCPVSDAPEMTHPRRIRHYRECARYREESIRKFIAMKPAVVILSSWDHYIAMNGESAAWQVTPEQWEAGLRRTYSRFARAGIQIIALRDVPRTFFDVPQCLSRRAAGLPFTRSCSYSRSASISQLGIGAQDRAARGLPVSFIDMNDVICPGPVCSPIRNGEVVFTDDNHITASFSRSVGDILGARIVATTGR